MTRKIQIITTPFAFNIWVNAYLVSTNEGYILIDTGMPNQRRAIEQALADAGCQPGALRLIILTHGDIDHCGNAAYLRQKFRAPIAMHPDDSGMVERGDMFWNRKNPSNLIRLLFGLFFGLGKADRFKPDFYVEDEAKLRDYGLDADVLHIPGHSKGSIGILTSAGDLFCGDLLGNVSKPELWSNIDDSAAANASVEKLKRFPIQTVYPGHGKPFLMEQLIANRS
ncbi:MAG: MBL fold metallo-hydrolase [Leptolyngbyaceae cyanobacterium MO_188.B28]|nr:MBL fold metallo-hydrolase [Leptolyngbyaceae cyanobacterium MO_188.B28]